jgi:hypothetical protein
MRTQIKNLPIALCVLAVGCSEDQAPSPMAPARAELKLAVFSSTFSTFNTPEPTRQSVIIEFGVFDEDPESFDNPPDIVLFGDRPLGDQEGFKADSFNTENFKQIVSRLTDGRDQYVYVSAISEFGSAINNRLESEIFQYPNGNSGPDLRGSKITAIQINARVIITENAGLWSTETTYTVTIIGH